MITEITKDIIQKFDTPGPRYTSYPTAPEWETSFSEERYQQKLQQLGRSDKTISLYVHLPFCESLCYFCGCTVVIRSQDEKYGEQYLHYLNQEIEMVARAIGPKKTVRQLHWGGGTPTFLNVAQIEGLYRSIEKHFTLDPQAEISIEIDPRTIDREKVKKLKELGFNRVSMGIQDFNPEVQKKVNRIQPYGMVADFNQWCREFGFQSINYDLIYGLPGQTKESFEETIQQVLHLKPDRIALYSFAYVPWLKKHQNKIAAADLPTSDQKLDIFLSARNRLLENDYQAIAMDHFALKTDEMSRAFEEGTLYRNFMGYTVKPADEFIGLGLSSIGFLEKTFVQNVKTLPQYYEYLKNNRFPVERGKELTHDDQIRNWTINRLMCRFELDKLEFFSEFKESFNDYFQTEQDHLKQCRDNGLITVDGEKILVTELGKIFVRNICMGFDWYLRQKNAHRNFSRTV